MKMCRFEKLFLNSRLHREKAAEHADRLLSHVPVKEGQRYLEVGCGNGAAAIHIARKYSLHVIGIDVDPDQIRCAREGIEEGPTVRFYVCDATNLPFEDGDFDIVSTFGVMHHVANWINALGEMRRVLKRGGHLIFFDFVYPLWIARVAEPLFRRYGFPSREDISAFVAEKGFTTLHSSFSRTMCMHRFEAVYRKER
jgi:ubiquinone/menaquinone biosynthesis C-methylase UbiE